MKILKNKYVQILGISLLSLLAFLLIVVIAANLMSSVGEERVWKIEHPSDIIHVEMDIIAADFRIETGEEFSIRSNLKHLEVTETADGLTIIERDRVEENHSHAFLVLTIPEEISFGDVKINFGAGEFYAQRLEADTFDFNYGTGDANIDLLYVSEKMTIMDGAGSLTIGDGSINNLHLDMGAGELNIRGHLLGHSELHFAMGDAKITLLGSDEIYTVSIAEHIGGVYINDMDFTHESVIGDGANHLDINGGVGTVNIYFER